MLSAAARLLSKKTLPRPSPVPGLLLGLALGVTFSACESPGFRRTTIRAATPAPTPPPIAQAPVGAPVLWPESAPVIFAKSAICIDARTGRVLFQKNADEPRQVASTQKLLTALIITERENLDGYITIAPEDTRVEPTKLGLRAGERYPRRVLLQAMMVKSSNDATAALARDHAGSEEAFAAEMTRVAYALGARSSLFRNAHGLPASQFSTARDMARIAFRAYQNPEIRAMASLQQMVFRHNSGRITTLKSTNDLLKKSSVHTGMKTGFTFAAGRCLISSANIGGREIILVQLGSKTAHIFKDAETVLFWAARQY